MTDQTAQPQAHTFTEAPASWNVKYTMRGFECMLTIRANSGQELMPQTAKVIKWLEDQEAMPGKPQPNGHIAPPPPPTIEQQILGDMDRKHDPYGEVKRMPAEEQHAYETIEVKTVAHVVSKNGHHSLNVKGGKYSKFGVTAWTEVIPAEGWETWEIGAEYAPPPGMRFATVQDGKKVTAFRAAPQA